MKQQHAMVVRRVPFNAVFASANRFRGRYRVLCGSAGSGKSVNVAQDLILRLSDPCFAGANLMVVRKTAESHRNSTCAELLGAIRRIFGEDWEQWWRFRSEPLMLESVLTGNRIIFRGMADDRQREKVKSVSFDRGKLCWIWIEEATELSSADFEILDDRLRGMLPSAACYYQLTLTLNPVSASHWIKARFFDVPPHPDLLAHRSTYLDNRFIDEGYHRRMMWRKEVDPEGYQVYGLGEWGECGGLILPRFEVDTFAKEREAYDFWSMGQDFGYNHANCLLLLGFRDEVVYVLRELYVREMDTAQIIALAKEQMFPFDVTMYCDSAEPDRIKTWRRAGFSAAAAQKGAGSVREQIDWLKQHRLCIDASCVNLLREIRGWKWRKAENGSGYLDEPAPGEDDAMAALRYGVQAARRARTLSLDKAILGV